MGRDSNGEEEEDVEGNYPFPPPIMNSSSKWEQDKSFDAQFLHQSWPMVSIKDSQDSSILFPPINHENLRTPYNHESHPASFLLYAASSSSSSSLSTLSIENDVESSDSTLTFSSSSSLGECVTKGIQDSRVSKLGGIAQWINLSLGVIYSKFKRGLLSFQSTSTARSTVVTLIMGFLYIGFRRRLRRRKESRDQLRRVIKEKDERINLLLHQIAQMNELLMGRK